MGSVEDLCTISTSTGQCSQPISTYGNLYERKIVDDFISARDIKDSNKESAKKTKSIKDSRSLLVDEQIAVEDQKVPDQKSIHKRKAIHEKRKKSKIVKIVLILILCFWMVTTSAMVLAFVLKPVGKYEYEETNRTLSTLS